MLKRSLVTLGKRSSDACRRRQAAHRRATQRQAKQRAATRRIIGCESLEGRYMLTCATDLCVDVQFVDTAAPSTALSELRTNRTYEAQVFIQDDRDDPSGIFQAYFDVDYDPSLITLPNASVDHGTQYSVAILGDASTAGTIDSVGGRSLGTPDPEGDSYLLFSFLFQTGSTEDTLALNFQQENEDANKVRFFIPFSVVPDSQITYAGTSIAIAEPPSPEVSVAATTNANESGTVAGVFTLAQAQITTSNTVLAYTVSGTATSGSDYTALSGTVTIPAGSSSATILVPITDDALVEELETVTVTLTSITSGDSATSIDPNSNAASIDIIDNDSAIISIAATRDGNESGSTIGQFTVSQSAASSTATVIAYSVVGGTAQSGTDFSALSGTVTIPAGSTSVVINVPVLSDSLIEGTETLTVQLDSITAGNTNVSLGTQNQASLNLIDDDTATVRIATTTDGNEAGPVDGVFTVTQSETSMVDTVVNYTVTGKAASGTDFTALSGSVTIPAGSTTATINVPTINDGVVEADETAIVTLNSITAGNVSQISVGSPSAATLSIIDNDSATVSIAPTADGSESGPTSGRFTLTQSAVSSTDTVVSYTVSGSATSGDDFTPLSGTVTIPAGSTTATIEVPVIDDSAVESDETVVVTLGSITSGDEDITINTGAQNATIEISDDEVPLVRIAATSDANEAGMVPGSFTVSQSIVTATNTVVTYTVSGSATSGSDFNALSGTATILAGSTSATINVPVADDAVVERTESVTLAITNIAGDSRLEIDSAVNAASVDIADNDSATVGIATTTDGDEAGPASGRLTVNQSNASTVDTVVSYTVTGTATSGSDFSALMGSVTIVAGLTSATIDVPVIDDDLVEANETVVITLDAITSGNLSQLTIDEGNRMASIGITDNDVATIEISADTDGNEAGPVDGQFIVTQSLVSSTDTVVSYTVSGTAAAGDDYTALSGAVTIPAGSSQATIIVPVIDDSESEGAESVTVTLDAIASGDSDISIGAANQTTLVITDNEVPQVGVSVTSGGNEAGPVSGVFTLTQSFPTSVDTVVTYTVAGAAIAGDDFTALAGTTTIPMGATSVTINIPVIDDALIEGSETVTLTITNISGDPLLVIDASNSSATVAIADDDTAIISIAATTDAAENGPTSGLFTVTQSVASTVDTIIAYTVTGTATTVDDFASLTGSLIIPAGSTTAAIDVSVIDDDLVEANESITITLDSVTGDAAGQIMIDNANDSATIQIVDNDSATISIAATTNGNETGPASGLFTVTQSAASSTDTVVNYSVGGTATSGSDFTAPSGSVTIVAGATTASIEIPVLDDVAAEGAESVSITLSSIASGDDDVTIGLSDEATLQISDDDVPRVSIVAGNDGNEAGTVAAVFTVTQSIITTTDTVVTYGINGAATAGEDFTAPSGTVTIPAGEMSATVTVAVLDDQQIEGAEAVTLSITNLSGDPQLELDVANQNATLDILDDESGLIRITGVDDASEAGDLAGEFMVTQDGLSSVDTVISYSVTGTATSGNDFVALTGTVTIAAGETTATIPVSINDDSIVEVDETIIVQLDSISSTNGQLAIDDQASSDFVLISDNDVATINISAGGDANEDGTAGGQLMITQSAVSSVDTVISYLVGGTATSGDDFTALSGTVTIPAGTTTATIDISVIGDVVVEEDETVQITLDAITSGNTAVSISPASNAGTVMILDDDAATISINAGEDGAEDGPTNGTFQVVQSAVSSTDTVISYSVTGTATAGEDFTSLSGTVTIAAGETTATISVSPIDDSRLEGSETVVVRLDAISSGDAELTIDTVSAEASIAIADDETGLVGIAATTDGNEQGMVGGRFTVTQDGLSDVDTVIAYSVAGAAVAGDDFTALSGTVTIPAGDTSATIDVSVLQDQLIEGTENLSVTLTNITSGDALFSIDANAPLAEIDLLDDDTGVVSIAATNDGNEASAVAGTFTVSQSGIASVDTVIAFSVTGDATAGDDFSALNGTLTILAGETTATIQVATIDDAVVEATESVIVTLGSITSGNSLVSIDTSSNDASINIVDNDVATVSISAASGGNEAGSVDGSFTLTQSAAASLDTVIAFSFTGTATQGDDFTVANSSVTIPAGATTATVTLAVFDDLLVEGSETLTVTLDSITAGDAEVTIDSANNDASLQILDNDLATIAFADEVSSVLELDGSLAVSVRLSIPGGGQLSEAASAMVTVTGGTAAAPGDFSLVTTEVTFPVGSQGGATQSIQLRLVDDQTSEDIETILLGLGLVGANSNVSLGTTTVHTVSITDDPLDAVLSGRVWVDSDGDGTLDVGELTIPGVRVQLTGTTLGGDSVDLETTSDNEGLYRFANLAAGTYTVNQSHPDGFIGDSANQQVTDIQVSPSEVVSGMHFSEAGLQAAQVNRFRILARPRTNRPLGAALTAEMIGETSQAASSLVATQPSTAQVSTTSASTPLAVATQGVQPEGEEVSARIVPVIEQFGSRLFVSGTADDDQIHIIPNNRVDTQQVHTIEINGEVNRYDADTIDTIVVSESAGEDTLVLEDTPGDDVLHATKDRVILTSEDLRVEAIAVDFIQAISRPGQNDFFSSDETNESLDYALELEGNWLF